MTLHDITGTLKITGVPQATAEQNEDGSFHIKLTAAVAGETGFKGSLAIEVQDATKPVTVKKEFTDEEETAFICWLMEQCAPLATAWTTEDENRRRELTWKDFTEGLASVRETAVSGVVSLRQQCDITFDKRKFLDNPKTYTTERMDALIRWAEIQKKTIVGYVERTMKAYGPEDER